MAESPEMKALFQAILDALKREDGAFVLPLAPQALAFSQDNKALRARVLAWLAQAEMFTGNYKAASAAAKQSIAIATEIGDTQGVNAVKALTAMITMKRQLAAGLAASPLPIDLPDTPVSRANGVIAMGDHVQGEALARSARDQARVAGNPREEVLALLALARIPARTTEAILEAAEVADQSNEPNLVTAVAQAAKAAGVTLAPKVF